MLALTSAGYCAYRWLKRSSDLQAAELQAAHGVSSDEIRLDQSPAVVKRPGETVKISCKIHSFDMTEYYMQPGKALEWLGQMDAGKNQPIYTETVKNQLTFTKDVSASLDL
ncbi:hypothetical protein KOW79_001877 [Hemibagrus wyckioides]|uniref:Ig-like domain-containing protein n=1 Tax=Hemibagrus wyckioides TaxID=337641 RepID=A0A9D3P754_9TELE|nr:hypothetical protein KOW79_001877 [Hemibagrus wyckioides]